MRTSDVARATGWSVQQVRDLEALGVLPPTGRSANGYRTFGAEHVLALRAYRGLATAVGPVVARRVLRDVRALPLDEAAALVGGLHVTLAREREEALTARRALLAIGAEPGTADPDARGDAGALTITQLAAALGVRTSTLRFWETEGLVAPERVATRGGSVSARLYPPSAVREARVTVALRAAGYRVPEVRGAIEALRRTTGPEDVADPLAALDGRLVAVARRTVALLEAGADVARLLAHADTDPGTPPG
ncbi:MerR family transcriptional regulator [Cellulosimicrobium protaetiae]|uniref:MerR family transcriptional regulator n=1 Tax=Cellulosimicrobium protaetiae TaxID=2587808 RepID=A0A6M5UM41_9MICO|nr:MerR family transcriptional regulator [Cellulosimicrobium protaetiae]